MDPLSLTARPRELLGRHVRALRRAGSVPCIVYGHNQQPIAVEADAKEVERLWHRAGRTQLVDLRIEGQKARKVLIRELQSHPRSGRVLHIDLFAVNLREKINADIPIVLTGSSPAVDEHKVGQILQTVSSVRVEALPGDLPPQLAVDVSGLTEVDAHVTLGEVELPKGVTLVHGDLAEVVVKIAPLRLRAVEEEEAAEAAAAEAAEGEAAEGGAGEAAAPEASAGESE